MEAGELLARALRIREQALGPDHPKLAFTLEAVGEVSMLMGEPARAIEPFERALVIRSAQAGDPKHLAKLAFELGKALWAAGRSRSQQRARARLLIEQAEAELAEAGEGAESLHANVRAWLDAH
ncbi:tetratricopeptide repeat protein [Enhygromyxa salina]|uniref:Tetratricopeptide repeat protein n=1 Tax=Enhygromyxa salina TaxID=215803 RepID=A0A2S9XX96_9BACT|nr:tetratricopeptide repeat protein [Enhygromyxa salina]PRP97350.1 hypothetical protein ENSA7_67000 [Enhygromyxa salina]